MNISDWRIRITAVAVFVLVATLIALALFWRADGVDRLDAASDGGLAAEQPMDAQRDAGSTPSRLASYFEKQPRDARAWVLHARRLADAERFAEAAPAYEKALALPSKVVKDPTVWCEYADVLAMTQQGKLAGKPRQLIDRALTLNPVHPKALEMAGSAEYELGNYASALRY